MVLFPDLSAAGFREWYTPGKPGTRCGGVLCGDDAGEGRTVLGATGGG